MKLGFFSRQEIKMEDRLRLRFFIFTIVIRSTNVYVIVSASKYGMIDFKINNFLVTDEDFKDILLKLKLKCLQLNISSPVLYLIVHSPITIPG